MIRISFMIYFSIQYMYPHVIARPFVTHGHIIIIQENMETRTVKLTKIPVELHKILKFENLASSGGEAKHMIAEGLVKVNGRVETQKQKKIYSGDIIETAGYRLEMERDVAI